MHKLGTWNLKDLVKDEKNIDTLLKETDEKVKRFENYRKLLKPDVDAKTINDMLVLSEEILKLIGPIGSYAHLRFTANNKDEAAIQLNNKLKQKGTEISNRMRFFDLWWKELDDANAKRIVKGLTINKYSMEQMREFRKHTLKENEESLISIKDDTGAEALNELYSMLTTSIPFKFRGKSVGEPEIMQLVRSKDATTRKDAYEALLKGYEEHKIPLGHIYQNLVSDYLKENIELRKYASPLGARALSDEVPVKVIETLLKVCRKNNGLFTDFFRLKKNLLKLKKMSIYDCFAPYAVKERKISYHEAVNLVFETFGEFDPEFRKCAEMIINQQHIDSEVRKNKYQSAFCLSSPVHTPYILMNFKEREEDTSTLIHELGHGVHGLFAKHLSMREAHATVGLAETASIFSEQLLFQKELNGEKDKKHKIARLISILDDIEATIQRQVLHVDFELQSYDLISKGCSIEDLNQLWLKLVRERFGEVMEVPELYKNNWLRIGHFFHWPFYCYGYAFGSLLVLALTRMYEKEGKAFIPKFKNILSHGGSKAPADILKEVGIDISSEQFWQQGFDVIREYIDELKQLA